MYNKDEHMHKIYFAYASQVVNYFAKFFCAKFLNTEISNYCCIKEYLICFILFLISEALDKIIIYGRNYYYRKNLY